MVSTELENDSLGQMREQQLGEDWIRAITEGALDRLEEYCHRKISGRLLIPAGLVNVANIADLIAEYRGWFGECSNLRVEASRVATVGEKLGIFYRLLLQDSGEWYRIEQQLYCTVKDGRALQVHLVCSGFQPVAMNDQAAGGLTS